MKHAIFVTKQEAEELLVITDKVFGAPFQTTNSGQGAHDPKPVLHMYDVTKSEVAPLWETQIPEDAAHVNAKLDPIETAKLDAAQAIAVAELPADWTTEKALAELKD